VPAGKKTACGACGQVYHAWYDRKIRRVHDLPCGDTRIDLELEIRRVHGTRCGKVKQEKLEWLADRGIAITQVLPVQFLPMVNSGTLWEESDRV
jgi:transposase